MTPKMTSGQVAGGSASITLNTTSLPVGNYSIVATYNPAALNPNFNPSNGTATLTRN